MFGLRDRRPGKATAARMPMIVMTASSSSKVKERRKAPNLNLQAPGKLQIPSSKAVRAGPEQRRESGSLSRPEGCFLAFGIGSFIALFPAHNVVFVDACVGRGFR